MNEFIENIKSGLYTIGELLEVLLNILSVVAIVLGIILSATRTNNERRSMPGPHPRHTIFRRNFGGWLVVALEFQLAADIVATIISPSYEKLIILGAVAVIRTFLNYFLVKELNEQTEYLERRVEKEETTISKRHS